VHTGGGGGGVLVEWYPVSPAFKDVSGQPPTHEALHKNDMPNILNNNAAPRLCTKRAFLLLRALDVCHGATAPNLVSSSSSSLAASDQPLHRADAAKVTLIPLVDTVGSVPILYLNGGTTTVTRETLLQENDVCLNVVRGSRTLILTRQQQ
jgi:hypothetical protein